MNILRRMSVRWICNSTVWQPSVEEWGIAAQCIQKEEKDRIGKFVFKRDAKSSMVHTTIHSTFTCSVVEFNLHRCLG